MYKLHSINSQKHGFRQSDSSRILKLYSSTTQNIIYNINISIATKVDSNNLGY